MENKQIAIDQQLSSARAITIARNKEKLKSIAETIIFCGRQGLALRGHRDDLTCQEAAPHANPVNFVALLDFRINNGDEILGEHLRTCGRNALYTSKTIQEQMIAICGDVVRSSILQEIRSAPMFSIMADEATDVSNKEQLALCIRYVNSSMLNIAERFLGFSECITGVTGNCCSDSEES